MGLSADLWKMEKQEILQQKALEEARKLMKETKPKTKRGKKDASSDNS